MNLDVGSIVGDYQIIAILGAGGMGKVFKVRNTISDRVEAMKVLLPDLAAAPELADRFLREIKVTASLDHPNIASLRTALRFENQLLMVMELVDGADLEHKLRQQGKLTAAEAADYVGQVLEALGYAHRLGVIHRDIKPANMMLTRTGVIKLMDFGIAKAEADRKLTMTGTTMGSLYYMSPEQIQGAQTLDKRTDLYALGVSLYELVTGKRPFDGDSQFAIMAAHLQTMPVPPVTLDPLVPAALNDVILHSVEKNPDERYQSAEDFRAALKTATSPPAATARMKTAPVPVAPTVVSQPPVGGTVAAPPKSRRLLWLAAGAFCAVAAVIGILEFSPSKPASAGSGVGQIVGQQPTQQVPAPAQEPQQQPPQQQPAAQQPSQQQQTPPKTSTGAGNLAQRQPQQQNPPFTQQTPPQQQPAQQQPQQQQQIVTQAPLQQPQQAPQGPSAADLAKRAELKKAGDALDLLQVRAGTIHAKLTGLEQAQAAQGLGLRSDWVSARTLMDQFLKKAETSLGQGDPAAAQDALDKAERQAGVLEKALHI